MARLLPQATFSTGIRPEQLTRDPTEQEAIGRDPAVHRLITIAAALEISHNVGMVRDLAPRIYAPVLMLGGGSDPLCSPDQMKRFAAGLSSPESQAYIYPEMVHDLLHDEGRETVIGDIAMWIAHHARRTAEQGPQYSLTPGEAIWQDVSSQSLQ
jgi:alpha-beta hydrolase superfamily lysophospholipase